MDDKIIVTNRSALRAKYKAAGVAKTKAAVANLIAADAKRGIKSRLVYLDDAAAMKRFRNRAVRDPGNARESKSQDGPTFDDRALDRYVGKRVKCDGFMVGYLLLAERIEVLP